MKTTNLAELPIGVFDSGVGGLTILQALRQRLPQESFLYLGDTARLPYGTKSGATIQRYALQAAHTLIKRGVKMLVIACNTASAHVLDLLKKEYPDLPIIGVIEPGAKAASTISKTGKIGVIATEGTISQQAYEVAIKNRRTDAEFATQSCSVLVALAEEGWLDGEITEAVVQRYVEPLYQLQELDCILLGCTHFPALYKAIRKVVPANIEVVNSADIVAEEVEQLLLQHNIAACGKNGIINFLATDSPQRFTRVAKHFLGDMDIDRVELVDIGLPLDKSR